MEQGWNGVEQNRMGWDRKKEKRREENVNENQMEEWNEMK